MTLKIRIIFSIVFLFGTQSCILGPLLTNRYVKKTSNSFSAYENIALGNLKVTLDGKEITTEKLKEKIILITTNDSVDSLIKKVNVRLRKSNLTPITVVKYEKDKNQKGKQNPFSNKKIFNVLVDKSGKIIGTNIREIEDDDQCNYYLDYSIYCLKDNLTLQKSFYDYKWGMIMFYKYDFMEMSGEDHFKVWFRDQVQKGIIEV